MNRLRSPLRNLTGTQHEVIADWLTGYISRPRDDLGRPGAVCPFVPRALRLRLVRTVGRPWDHGEAALVAATDLIQDALALFRSWPWPPEHPELRAVVAAAPGMPQDLWTRLDQAQQQLKDIAVTAGLMIGAFHADSTVPAANNPDIAPNVAPYPLVVVRQMARHDLLFLHGREGWFREYQGRFADRLDPGGDSDLARLYQATAARYDRLSTSAAEHGWSAGPTRGSAVQAAWTGFGHELTMITVLDPCPRWRHLDPGGVLPAPGETAMLAARWTGPDDDPHAPGLLAQAAALAARTPVIDLLRLAEDLPDGVELIALQASAVLGPRPGCPAAAHDARAVR